jgi:hypothetical protein
MEETAYNYFKGRLSGLLLVPAPKYPSLEDTGDIRGCGGSPLLSRLLHPLHTPLSPAHQPLRRPGRPPTDSRPEIEALAARSAVDARNLHPA